jgi:hypothetical protein
MQIDEGGKRRRSAFGQEDVGARLELPGCLERHLLAHVIAAIDALDDRRL